MPPSAFGPADTDGLDAAAETAEADGAGGIWGEPLSGGEAALNWDLCTEPGHHSWEV